MAKKASKKTESSPPPPPKADRTVSVVAKPQLSGVIPTVPSRPKPQVASFRSTKKQLVNPRRVRGGVKTKAKPGEPPKSWVTQRVMRVAEQAAQDAEAVLHVAELAELVVPVVHGAESIARQLHVKPAPLQVAHEWQ